MARVGPQNSFARHALPVSIIVLAILGLLPARFLGWTSGLSELAMVFIAPLSNPVSSVGSWLRPAESGAFSDERLRVIEQERDRFQTLYLRERNETGRLRETIRLLQGGLAVAQDVPIDVLSAPVIGKPSDPSSPILYVRAGSRDGLTRNSIATAGELQLVGRVAAVRGQTSDVLPITGRGAGAFDADVLLDAEGRRVRRCQLSPAGNGLLRGEVEFVDAEDSIDAPNVPVGAEVRLNDASWPRSAQLLVVGRVERAELSEAGRTTITVRPTLVLGQVSEVVLRIPAGGDDGDERE